MKHNFKVGDHVRIRQWDDMAKEYGVFSTSIPIPASFVDGMKNLCGEEAIITGFDFPNHYHSYTSVDLRFKTATKNTSWAFSPEMLEPIVRGN